jgi:hypothetical protein
MRTSTALHAAELAFFLSVTSFGICLAQSGAGGYVDPNPGGPGQESSSASLTATASSAASGREAMQTEDAEIHEMDAAEGEPGAPAQRRPGEVIASKIGIGVKISTLGAGIESAIPLAGKLNLRGGFNMFRYDRGITNSGIQYTGQLRFQSAEAHLDFYPLGGIHVSPGVLFYNGNQLTATAAVPGGQTFTLSGTTYESDPGTPVAGTGKLDFIKVAPSIMVGVGNLVPRSGRHWSILFEVGGAYQGSARVALNLTGNVCDTGGLNCRAISSDPTVQSNVTAQQNKISKDLNPYRFFPILSLGAGFNF